MSSATIERIGKRAVLYRGWAVWPQVLGVFLGLFVAARVSSVSAQTTQTEEEPKAAHRPTRPSKRSRPTSAQDTGRAATRAEWQQLQQKADQVIDNDQHITQRLDEALEETRTAKLRISQPAHKLTAEERRQLGLD